MQGVDYQRFRQGIVDFCPFQQVDRTSRPGIRLGIGKTFWSDQMQVGQSHGFHGPRRRTDIAGMTRSAEDNTDTGEQDFRVHSKIRPFQINRVARATRWFFKPCIQP